MSELQRLKQRLAHEPAYPVVPKALLEAVVAEAESTLLKLDALEKERDLDMDEATERTILGQAEKITQLQSRLDAIERQAEDATEYVLAQINRELRGWLDAAMKQLDIAHARWDRAETRLDAVLRLCDEQEQERSKDGGGCDGFIQAVREAAGGPHEHIWKLYTRERVRCECGVTNPALFYPDGSIELLPPDGEAQEPSASADDCGACYDCLKDKKHPSGLPIPSTRMILCPDCGNKRCPKATDHRYTCTDSNESGQPGSRFAKYEPKGKYDGALPHDVRGWHPDD